MGETRKKARGCRTRDHSHSPGLLHNFGLGRIDFDNDFDFDLELEMENEESDEKERHTSRDVPAGIYYKLTA